MSRPKTELLQFRKSGLSAWWTIDAERRSVRVCLHAVQYDGENMDMLALLRKNSQSIVRAA